MIYGVETVTFQVVILLLSVFALLNDDIRLMSLPKSVDKIFIRLNEIVFCLLVAEFLILCIFKKKFICSFYFWLEVLSLLSLLPEVHFIWLPLEHAISEE